MAVPTRIEGDLRVNGHFSAKTAEYPAGSVNNAAIAAGAAIAATKVVHQFQVGGQLVAPGTVVDDMTQLLHCVYGVTGTIVRAEAFITTVATSSGSTILVDLHKSTGGGAFSTLCTTGGTLTFTSTATVRVPSALTLTSNALVDGDILQAVVTTPGSSAALPQGLFLSLIVQEDPQ